MEDRYLQGGRWQGEAQKLMEAPCMGRESVYLRACGLRVGCRDRLVERGLVRVCDEVQRVEAIVPDEAWDTR